MDSTAVMFKTIVILAVWAIGFMGGYFAHAILITPKTIDKLVDALMGRLGVAIAESFIKKEEWEAARGEGVRDDK